MAINVAEAIVKFQADVSQIKSQVNALYSNLENQGRVAGERMGAKMGGGFATSFARELLPILGGGVMAKLGMGFASFKEQAELTFKVLLKDGQKATEMFQFLYEYAKKTPFELEGIMNASLMLQAFGLNVQHWMPIIGDWASAMQSAGVSIDRVAEALSYAATGRFAIAIRSLATTGISQMELMKKGLKFSEGNEYLGTYEQFFRAIEEIAKEKFGGMADAQSKTFRGMMTTIQDELRNILSESLSDTMAFLKEIMEGFLSLSEGAKTAIVDALVIISGALSVAFGGPLGKIIGALMLIVEIVKWAKKAIEALAGSANAEAEYQMDVAEFVKTHGRAPTPEEVSRPKSKMSEETRKKLEGAKLPGFLETGNLLFKQETEGLNELAEAKKKAQEETKKAIDQMFNDPTLGAYFDSLKSGLGEIGSTAKEQTSEVKEELTAIEKLNLAIAEGWDKTNVNTDENLRQLAEMTSEYNTIVERKKVEWYWESKSLEAQKQRLEALEEMQKLMAVSVPEGGLYGSLNDLLDSIVQKQNTLLNAIKEGKPFVEPQWNVGQKYLLDWLKSGGLSELFSGNKGEKTPGIYGRLSPEGEKGTSAIADKLGKVFEEANKRMFKELGLGISFDEFQKLPDDIKKAITQIAEIQDLEKQVEAQRQIAQTQMKASEMMLKASENMLRASGVKNITATASQVLGGGGGKPALMMQEGGYVRKPTLVLAGERGAEYIIPEGKLEALFTKLIEGMRFGDRQPKQREININVKSFGLIDLLAEGVAIE